PLMRGSWRGFLIPYSEPTTRRNKPWHGGCFYVMRSEVTRTTYYQLFTSYSQCGFAREIRHFAPFNWWFLTSSRMICKKHHRHITRAQTACSPVSSVRILIAFSIALTKTLPSPIFPVR